MASLASEFEILAIELLSEFDERRTNDFIQLEQTPVDFNPTTGEDELGTPVIINLVGVVVEFTNEFTNEFTSTGGEKNTIQSGDQLLKITSSVEPFMGDKILLDGLKYSIVDISPSRYTNKILLYTVHIRK